jgi:hypothetical protein
MSVMGWRIDHDHCDEVLPSSKIIKPACEQAGAGDASALTNFVRVSQCLSQKLTDVRDQLRVSLRDMSFALISQLDGNAQDGTRKQLRRSQPPT